MEEKSASCGFFKRKPDVTIWNCVLSFGKLTVLQCLKLVVECVTLFLINVSSAFPLDTNIQISFSTISFRPETTLGLFLLVAHGTRSHYS